MFAPRSTSANVSVIRLATSGRRARRHHRRGCTTKQSARLQRAVMETLELRQLLSVVMVTSSGDSGSGTLRDAVNAANPGDTIEFSASVTSPITLAYGPIVIAKNDLTIDGPGAAALTIKGDSNDPVFEIAATQPYPYSSYAAYTATISGLTISGGKNAGNAGGGIINYGDLTLNNSVISGDSAAFGGGIYNRGTLDLNGDLFNNDTTTSDGGAIDNAGLINICNNTTFSDDIATSDGGAVFNQGKFDATGATFYSNHAVNGGAIYNDDMLTLNKCSLTGDSASGDGGEIFNHGHATIVTSTLSGHATSDGGGIFNYGGGSSHGTLDLVQSTLSNDTAANGAGIFNYGPAIVIDSTLNGDTATGAGGGIFDEFATNLIESTLANNTAGTNGGAIDVDFNGSLTATNATISGNSAAAGGGIYIAAGAPTLINNTIVSGNSSNVSGTYSGTHNIVGGNAMLSALGSHGGPTQTMALLSGSPAIGTGSDALAIDGDGEPLVTDQRGYYRIRSASVPVDIGAFEYNAPAAPSSLVVKSTADTVPFTGVLTLRQAIGFANFADGSSTITFDPSVDGHTIDVVNGPLTFNNPIGLITVQGPGEGSMTVSGGGIGRVFAVDFGANAALTGLTISGGFSSDGGAIVNHGTLNLTSDLLKDNTATSEGGAIDNEEATLTVSECTFSGNTAGVVNTSTGDGAAISNNGGYVTLANSDFSSDVAYDEGGAVANGGNLFVNNTIFDSNYAANSGGAIQNSIGGDDGTADVTGGGFSRNFTGADGTGGAIDNPGILNVQGAAFYSNTAATGGAVSSPSGVSEIDDSTFNSDSATGAGGGIYTYSGSVFLNGDSLTGESAGGPGGAIFDDGRVSIYNSTFSGDHTDSGGGGAIYNYGSLTVFDSTFSADYTTGAVDGGAIDDNAGFAELTNCTIADNFAYAGGGINVNYGGDVVLYNTIVGDNTLDNHTTPSDVYGTLDAYSGYNLIGSSTSGGLVDGNYGNIVGVDPLLSGLGNYGGSTLTMAPLPGSPAIDAGSNALAVDEFDNPLMSDQRGQPRFYGSSVDIGADEIQGYMLIPAGGSGQTAPVDTTFGSPLTVQVVANNGLDPVDGGMVTFSDTTTYPDASAMLIGQNAALSDAESSQTVKANNVTGSYVVVATVDGATAEFTLTNTEYNPTITTTPGPTVVIGSGSKLTDSATISDGFNETGTIVFTLYGPGNTIVDTETVNVSGNGTYSTPTGYVPTTAGTYEWVVNYGGDSMNSPASSPEGNEPETVSAASPAITTTPGATIVIGSGSKLTDSATLSDGFNETGTIVFTLYDPNNNIVDTETVAVNGNGTYSTPTGYVPTTAGTYEWVADYGGDSDNNSAISSEGNEPEIVNAASPTITTTPGGTVVIGSGSKLTDSATLSGGYDESRTVVFTLYGPDNTVVDTETVTVSGNGTYVTPSGFTPTTAGTYEWVASYGGDSNNNAVTSPEGDEPEVVSAASPSIATTPNLASVTLSTTSPTLEDSAVLSGGYDETGSITFTLVGPGNTTLDTETVSVSGPGTYTTPSGYMLPASGTVTGVYQWNATYSGDANNNSASEVNSTSEQTTVNAASPAISTTPGGTVVIGSGGDLADTATLSGGYNETGTIVFTLYAPDNSVVDTETVTVNGNGTYATPTGYVPTSAGTYEWAAVYNGDSNNNSVTSSVGSEPEVVTAASPAITTTPGGTIVIGSGSKLTDSATLTGGFNETGTIVFTLYSPSNAVVDTETVTVSGNGTYSTPTGYVPTAIGTYEWAAVFSGDANNSGASSSVGSEPETVVAATPTITTTTGGSAASGLTDTATLSGGYNETGSIVFTLYSPSDAVVYTATVSVSGNGSYSTPSGYVPTGAGTYEWAANYSGDTDNNSATSPVGSEPVVVSTSGPSISTTPGGTIVIGSGSRLTDSATLSGGMSETGTIVFTLYSPNNVLVDTETVTVSGNGTYSTPTGFVPTSTGTYEWAAAYSGDSSNTPVSSPAGSEPETVVAASPAISTTPGATIVIGSGSKLTDSATLSGGYSETGSIVFTLYSPSNVVVYTTTVSVSGNGTYSIPTGYVPTSAGTYEWAATYSGDSNNNSVTSPVGSEPEVVKAASPAISTTPGGTIVIGSGSKLTDSATLSGGYNETGTIIFTLYSPSNTVVDTETVTVSGNGTYSTPTGYVPVNTGTFEWAVTYNGDSNNNSVISPVGSEPETVNAASPTITTTPGGTVAIGSGTKLTDSATLSGGFNETGTIVFTLYSPSNTVVDTETATVSGNGTYSTPNGYTPTIAGTYEWVATYSGSANNNGAISPFGSEPEVASVQQIDLNVVKTVCDVQQNCCISSNFNGTSLCSGDDVWFNCNINPTLPSGCTSVTYNFSDCQISFSCNGTKYCINAPNSCVTYSSSCTTATTTYNASQQCWVTTCPLSGLSGNTFLDGCEYQVPSSGLPGGISNVTWCGNLIASVPNCSAQWQWAAACYDQNFSSNYNNLGIKPCDDNSASCFKNSDHCGTPENYKGTDSGTGKSYLCGGATGGGGSNCTGSYSGTGSCNNLCTSTAQACEGDTVLYTVTLSNAAGYSTATGVVLSDVLPAGLTFVSATPSQGSFNSSTGIWTVGTIASGSSVTLQVYAKTTTYGVFVNTAEVTAANQTDVNPNPEASATLVVGASLTGEAFIDANGNGVLSSGEIGLAGVTVELIDSRGNVVLTTTSSSTGAYSFLGVAPGNYQVEFIAPTGDTIDGVNGSSLNNCGSNYGSTSCSYNNTSYCYGFNWCGQNYSGWNGGNNNCGYTYTSCGGGSYSYTYCDSGQSNWGWGYSWGNSGWNCGGGNSNCGNGSNIATTCVTLVCGQTVSNYNVGVCLPPSTLSGYVYFDISDDGSRDSGDPGISNILITLTGTTAGGQSITLTTHTASDGSYSFNNLAAGTYQIAEGITTGYTEGTNSIGTDNGVTDGSLTGIDKIGTIVLASGDSGINYNFGEFKTGSALTCGDTATIGFWNNKNGQNLINSLNGSSTSKSLGNWLAVSFGNLYGSLAGMTNSQVAAYYNTLFNVSGQKTAAQVMSTALAVYVTCPSLAGGSMASSYGFYVNTDGTAINTYNVGTQLASYGGPTGNVDISVLLQFVDSVSSNGTIAAGNTALQNIINSIFTAINQAGDV